jgi:hypothetical protein
MGKTLWQHWTQKEEKKEENVFHVYSDLGFKPGQIISFDVLDYRGKDFVIERVEEHTRRIDGKDFVSTDYVFTEDAVPLKVRSCDKKGWLIHLYDQFAFDEGFLTVVKDAMESSFNLDDIKAEYLPIDGGCATIQIKDDLGEQCERYLWTFGRIAKDEAGQDFNEVLFIEQDKATGWFELWLGVELPTDRMFVL